MTDQLQARLLRWAAAFLFLFSIILTLSPAVRERSLAVDYRWSHWLGFGVWLLFFALAGRVTSFLLPDRDPYLLPGAALLTGWGLLTIWRLDPIFGLRQALWLMVSMAACLLGLRLAPDLGFLRRYKYLLLTSGLILTALTLIFGTNPGGFGPRLWLGCCGFYFQPSEPLKLLLVVYLSAYLADRLPVRMSFFPFFLPTIFVTGLALLLLLVQRDLGTASILILLYSTMVYLATTRRRVLIGTVLALGLAGLIGYFYIGVVQVRLNALFDPWSDPGGSSYQIIQSLLAIANGGAIGRGPGLGSPTIVPVAISDFIFSAIVEETGLVGALGLLATLGLILARGLRAALRAPDRFRRFLAAGITAYLGIQSLLIIGGNLRLLPLTGVTLPFISYGGSSLLTSFIALLFLLRISSQTEAEPAPLSNARPYTLLAAILGLGLGAVAIALSWWTLFRGPDLLTRTDNPRRAIADRYVPRGELLDRDNVPIDATVGESGNYLREYRYPELGPIAGYTHPVFGQAGLEAKLDDYLRGLQGNPASLIWWDHLLYGTPPPGLDVRLSLQLALQGKADALLGAHPGAIVLINASNGEILVMASHPTFDPNLLDEEGRDLAQNPAAPLINRAAQGAYLPGTVLQPLVQAQFGTAEVSEQELQEFYEILGLYDAPQLHLPVNPPATTRSTQALRVTPLQVALAAAALSNHGTVPAPRIALAVNTLQEGWVILPALDMAVQAIPARAADEAARSLVSGSQPFWQHLGQATPGDAVVTWFIGGTVPDWQGTPLTLVVLLEENNTFLAQHIGDELLQASINP
ncbi:MAG TPA: FtsW/RodA/SpoVE family cell cycle protein [Anaerolineales bacterium]|jgi:cell division protein FtsW (lipid II flippase)